MEIANLSTVELISLYSRIISIMKERKVIRSKNLLGDLGEFLVIEFFTNTPSLPNLQSAPSGTRNVDAISRRGERYSIKSTSGNLTGSFWGLNPPESDLPDLQEFEFLLIACFNGDYQLKRIIQLTWDEFLKFKSWNVRMKCWKISITNALLNACVVHEIN